MLIFFFQNPLKLALDIVKSSHTAINKSYSDDMRSLVDLMLRKVSLLLSFILSFL